MNKPDIIFSSNVYVTAMLIFMPNATKASSCNASATIHLFTLFNRIRAQSRRWKRICLGV